jgi:hypothetical protein
MNDKNNNKNFTNKIFIAMLMMLAVIVSACTTNGSNSNTEEPVMCTADAKICADGSGVGRDPNNGCQFFPCPEDVSGSNSNSGEGKIDAKYRNYAANSIEECAATTFICDVSGTKAFFDQSGCGCEAVDPKIYTTQNLEECSRIKYMCIENHVPFTDEIGCGCEFSWEQVLLGTGNLPVTPEKTYCEDTQRGENIACTMDYNPVCGWNDSGEIQCIKYPCAETYSNGCVACSNEYVEYYTPGECPTE